MKGIVSSQGKSGLYGTQHAPPYSDETRSHPRPERGLSLPWNPPASAPMQPEKETIDDDA
ncbi:hypothetical protein GCM10020216_019880 [Nonomuraea helvata]